MNHELRQHQALLVCPKRWEARAQIVDSFAFCEQPARTEERAGNWWEEEDIYGEPLPAPMTEDGVAVIPVKGIITCGLPKIYRAFGYADCDQIKGWLRAAVADEKVSGIVLDVDSPGGTIGGVMELAQAIEELQRASGKKIVTYTRGQCCSAAYWITAGSYAILASPSADVGSIGVYLAMYDQSKRFEIAGYRVEIIKAGSLKAIGVPGTPLTDAQREHLQEGVDEIYGAFTAHVSAHRASVSPDAMQGQAFSAARALEAGLIDDITDDMEEVKALAKR